MDKTDIVIIGGFGRVGLPLGIALANKGKRVCALDTNPEVEKIICSGKMPFIEKDAQPVLQKVLNSGYFSTSLDASVITKAEVIVIVIGTPIDLHLDPDFEYLQKNLFPYAKYFREGQLVVLRSTVYPGTTEKFKNWLHRMNKNVDVSFCPERISEGYALEELYTLPQIVSSFTEAGVKRSVELFELLTPEVVVVSSPLEAELAKLFTNAYRYTKFAVANQFFMIAKNYGADFTQIYKAVTYKYPRAVDLPTPGFAAGPCLYKDTLQLSAFTNHTFFLGHASVMVNEGLPYYIIEKLKQKFNIKEKTIGILGMAFKADIDDPRDSLSYKLRKILMFECKEVLCSDPYIKEESFIDEAELVEKSDIVILGIPHRRYKNIEFSAEKIVVDIWNFFGKGFNIV